jgi:hypothetical protein
MSNMQTWVDLVNRANDATALAKEIFEKMEAVPPGGFVSDLGYVAVGKDALGFQVLRRGHTDKSERFECFEEVLAYILRVYW